MTNQKKIVIIAGPNGAGKTTFAREFLPNEGDCPVFVNADLIAAGISPFQPEAAAFRAGRLMLQEITQRQSWHQLCFRNHAIRTDLRSHDPRLEGNRLHCKTDFLSLGSVDEAIARVAIRVRQGGHDVPVDTIHCRFDAGRVNFRGICSSQVDSWQLFDNGGEMPLLLDEGENT